MGPCPPAVPAEGGRQLLGPRPGTRQSQHRAPPRADHQPGDVQQALRSRGPPLIFQPVPAVVELSSKPRSLPRRLDHQLPAIAMIRQYSVRGAQRVDDRAHPNSHRRPRRACDTGKPGLIRNETGIQPPLSRRMIGPVGVGDPHDFGGQVAIVDTPRDGRADN